MMAPILPPPFGSSAAQASRELGLLGALFGNQASMFSQQGIVESQRQAQMMAINRKLHVAEYQESSTSFYDKLRNEIDNWLKF